jgi:hypothetical protein
MEYFINLPPTPEGEISCLKGDIGWGVPLGMRVARHLNICAECYTHIPDIKKHIF